MGLLVLDGVAIANEVGKAARSGMDMEKGVRLAALAAGALWAAGGIESEIRSLNKWAKFYQDRSDRFSEKLYERRSS